ncbi:hypothetical protein AVEN_200200-1, partial [Araneus ventricosus]
SELISKNAENKKEEKVEKEKEEEEEEEEEREKEEERERRNAKKFIPKSPDSRFSWHLTAVMVWGFGEGVSV